ncbi:uncharacterized protein LOC142557853 isoform X3 [Dermacentor variabilis]|uniref:uncharacterized protein LOC142557853 isoform X3 n=1 Tax=Dermacentor variabilis TaxID=34621 RepID=UPI003F5AF168
MSHLFFVFRVRDVTSVFGFWRQNGKLKGSLPAYFPCDASRGPPHRSASATVYWKPSSGAVYSKHMLRARREPAPYLHQQEPRCSK